MIFCKLRKAVSIPVLFTLECENTLSTSNEAESISLLATAYDNYVNINPEKFTHGENVKTRLAIRAGLSGNTVVVGTLPGHRIRHQMSCRTKDEKSSVRVFLLTDRFIRLKLKKTKKIDNGKPGAIRGRKATGPTGVVGLPKYRTEPRFGQKRGSVVLFVSRGVHRGVKNLWGNLHDISNIHPLHEIIEDQGQC